MEGIWQIASFALDITSALACLVLAGWLYPRRERFGEAGTPIVSALGITALWVIAVHGIGPMRAATLVLLSLSYVSWLWTLYRLFANDYRHTNLRPIRPVVFALVLVELLQLVLIFVAERFARTPQAVSMIFEIAVMFRLLFAVGALVLVHNLYIGASPGGRQVLRWPAAALAAMWLYDLNLYTVAYLSGGVPESLGIARGAVPLLMAALLALGSSSGRGEWRFRPSRFVAFQSFSLLIIGGYLVGMVLIAQGLAYIGNDFARFVQLAFIVAASAAAMVLLPSARLRGWLRVMAAKHLFQHRYDYRAEWLRFNQTIARGSNAELPLHARVIRVVADITDSQSGLLLTPGEDGGMVLDTNWQWPGAEVPALALSAEATGFFEREGFILDLDELLVARNSRFDIALLPDWLREENRAWALVPLIHYQRLVGIVVLSRPALVRRLDWEDFDLLRVVGQQLASYLAEQAGQEALSESQRFDEFNRRIAFVMHDIKNLASQLSLLARNAEKHADNPDFRADMLVTLRNSSDKLNALLARLSRYGAGGADRLVPLEAGDIVKGVVARFAAQHPVMVSEIHPCVAIGNAEALDQALVHLVQNAIDASEAESPVMLSVVVDGLYCQIDVIDAGRGMSPDFMRTRLFKPFHSSKPGGFGIGAFEARELVRAMQGRLDVESREGLGTRFSIRLPLSISTGLRDSHDSGRDAGTSEVA